MDNEDEDIEPLSRYPDSNSGDDETSDESSERSNRKKCTGNRLADALREVGLTAEEAKAWHGDLRAGRKILKAPKDRW